jgi:hypothetical protein
MVEMRLYVEGGGDSKQLRTACRQGFAEFLVKVGLKGHMPRIVACGGRRQAYDDFCTALTQGHSAMLLVDSEDPVAAQQPQDDPEKWRPWQHLAQRPGDQWQQPAGSNDLDCHLMVQCMENWFLADRESLSAFFGQGYNGGALPPAGNPVESVTKLTICQGLANATKNCKTKRAYGKGEHSFLLLGQIDPTKVIAASKWASRFVTAIKKALEP